MTLLSAHNAKHKAKSRVLNHWKESFMDSADWCIPLGLQLLLLWRERSDFGVIILTVQLPIIFNCFSVLCEISKVKWCKVPLMAYTVSVLVNSHWFFPLAHNLSRVEKTRVFVLAYVLTRWPWRVACNINDQIVLCQQRHWIHFHCIWYILQIFVSETVSCSTPVEYCMPLLEGLMPLNGVENRFSRF